MKKTHQLLFVVLFVSFIIPNIALASWWNPFSWDWRDIFSTITLNKEKVTTNQDSSAITSRDDMVPEVSNKNQVKTTINTNDTITPKEESLVKKESKVITESQTQSAKILKSFINDILITTGVIPSETRARLDNDIILLGDYGITTQWNAFVDSEDEETSQNRAGELMIKLVYKLNGDPQVSNFLNLFIINVLQTNGTIAPEKRMAMEKSIQQIGNPNLTKYWDAFANSSTGDTATRNAVYLFNYAIDLSLSK